MAAAPRWTYRVRSPPYSNYLSINLPVIGLGIKSHAIFYMQPLHQNEQFGWGIQADPSAPPQFWPFLTANAPTSSVSLPAVKYTPISESKTLFGMKNSTAGGFFIGFDISASKSYI